jgi:hypothetical protein
MMTIAKPVVVVTGASKLISFLSTVFILLSLILDPQRNRLGYYQTIIAEL